MQRPGSFASRLPTCWTPGITTRRLRKRKLPSRRSMKEQKIRPRKRKQPARVRASFQQHLPHKHSKVEGETSEAHLTLAEPPADVKAGKFRCMSANLSHPCTGSGNKSLHREGASRNRRSGHRTTCRCEGREVPLHVCQPVAPVRRLRKRKLASRRSIKEQKIRPHERPRCLVWGSESWSSKSHGCNSSSTS